MEFLHCRRTGVLYRVGDCDRARQLTILGDPDDGFPGTLHLFGSGANIIRDADAV